MSHSSPLIGVTADELHADPSTARAAKTSLVLPYRYVSAIEAAGGVPIILPNRAGKTAMRRYLSLLHGLVLSGGDFDIHPRHYGAKPSRQLGTIKSVRTDFELTIARAAMIRDLPVLGICGGAQAINVALGGSLYQDIATELGKAAIEHTSKNAHGGHAVRIQAGSQLFKIFQRPWITVNTSHHQSVKRLGRGLIVNALADDGVIEGIESTRHSFVMGVQWHPEVLVLRQRVQRRVFSAFVERCHQRLRSR
jgi:putative glutamine amidotransferase